MRIAIFGSGGVGGFYGARLLRAGEDVTFIARGAHLQAIRERGLRVESAQGGSFEVRARATDRPEEIGEVDWVLCAVKAWQVPEAGRAMAPLLGERGAVLPLQNGIEAPDQLAEIVGRARVVGGATWIAAEIQAPGVIHHAGAAQPRIVLGELDGRPSARADELRAAFARAGVRCETSTEIRAVLWTKLVFIAAVSGVGSLARANVGELRALPETRRLVQCAAEETAAVARAQGVVLRADVVAGAMAFLDGLAPHVSASMQRDFAEGRPTELEAQNGAVARLGRAMGVPTPTHDFIYGALLPQHRRALQAAGLPS